MVSMSNYYGKYNILNTFISACDIEYILSAIRQSIQTKKGLIIAPIASHPVILSFINPVYNNVLNSFNIVIPDSYYLKFALQFLYKVKLKKRIYGPELFITTCKYCDKNNYKVLLFGNYPESVKNKLLWLFPSLQIKCVDVTDKLITTKRIDLLKKTIRDYNPEVIFIGIGSPRQHYIANNLLQINKPIVTVGAAFSFISGRTSQAPSWIGNIGLEWLYRFILEPRRLWKRYLVYGPMFIFLLLKQKIYMSVNENDSIQ